MLFFWVVHGTGHQKTFQRRFSLQLMYKYQFKNGHIGAHPFSGFQLTEVWGTTFAKGLCTFSGFCDLWYDPNVNGKMILLSELSSGLTSIR